MPNVENDDGEQLEYWVGILAEDNVPNVDHTLGTGKIFLSIEIYSAAARQYYSYPFAWKYWIQMFWYLKYSRQYVIFPRTYVRSIVSWI